MDSKEVVDLMMAAFLICCVVTASLFVTMLVFI